MKKDHPEGGDDQARIKYLITKYKLTVEEAVDGLLDCACRPETVADLYAYLDREDKDKDLETEINERRARQMRLH